MIQAAGLLLSGIVAVGLWRSGDFVLLLAFWTIGLVLHAGLSAAGRDHQAAVAARHAFLTECVGSCALALSGLAVVLAIGTVQLDQIARALPPLPQDVGLRAWAGSAVLLAVACRLGLPPLPWWPARVAAAPPAVRVFLLGTLHPATAILLLYRLEELLLPWHMSLAHWLGGSVSFLLILAAAGERHAARRMAWLSAGHWAGLFSAGTNAAPAVPAVLAVGLVLVHLHTILVRWPVTVRKTLLATGGLVLLTAGHISGLARPDSLPGFLRLAAVLTTAWVLRCWWHETVRAEIMPPTAVLRRPALGSMTRLAALGQGDGPLTALIALVVPRLGRIAADVDRIVLAGLVEGLGRFALGVGRLAAWLDRQGQDLVYGGASRLLTLAGLAAVNAFGVRPQRVLMSALAAILGLVWIGKSLG